MNRKLKLLIALFVTSAAIGGVAAATSSPSVSTTSATSIKTTSAVLRGTVNPNGASTTYQFQLGLIKGQYGVAGAARSAGHGTVPRAVQFTATRLIPGTVYHYRVVASSRFGITAGADRTFKTAGHPPPLAATGPVSTLGRFSAVVTGIVNPHGERTTWYFQYWTAFPFVARSVGGVVGAGDAPVAVSELLLGLQPGAIWHYQIVAVHGNSVPQFGNELTFMSLPFPTPVPRVQARTTPHRDRHRPYVFTTSGRVVGPSSIPQSYACFQNLTVGFFLGRRQVAFGLVPVQPNCTFSGQTTFNHFPGRGRKRRQVKLRVEIHFRGNGYLAPANARSETVFLGKG
jgi:hypothetical protein